MGVDSNMYSPSSSTFWSDNTPEVEQQALPPDKLSNSADPIPTFYGAGIYLRLLNLWHAAISRMPGPSRLMVQQCPRCGALSASPDEALMRNWERIHCCPGRRHVQDAL